MLLFLAMLATAVPCEGWLHPSFIGPPRPERVVSGRVLVGRDREPCRWAFVVVENTRRVGMTDPSGVFRIDMVPAGDWKVRVFVPERETLTVPIVVPAEDVDVGELLVDPDAVSPSAPLVRTPSTDLVATIRAPSFGIGDRPQFDVRIANHGTAAVWLVRAVEGSDRIKSPEARIDIAGPVGGLDRLLLGRCGNTSGVHEDDFVAILPGKEFDPFAGGWSSPDDARFVLPGTYTATFHYATRARSVDRWVAGPCDDCEVGPALRRKIEEVLAVELTATTTFEVRP